jgi:hypothetical protein
MSGYFGLGAGASSGSIGANSTNAQRFQNTVGDGTLTQLEVLSVDATPTGNMVMAVYSDNAGDPNALLLNAGAAAVVNGWIIIAGLALAVTNGTWYWLAFNQQNANDLKYQAGVGGSHRWDDIAYPGLNDPYDIDGTNANQMVMRAYVDTTVPAVAGGSAVSKLIFAGLI